MFGSLLFIGLNVVDACLTNAVVGEGFASEGNISPFAQAFGSNLLLKVLLSIFVVLVMHWVNKGWVFWLANLGMFAVVSWNAWLFFTMSMWGGA